MTTTTSALPIAAIPVERFVERLYAPLAWEATVRLGDPAIASRLVERVLHRAWEERERFATFDALFRHVQDAAMAAVTSEAERRRDVTRFDDARADVPVPGSLESMSVDAVRRRIGEGRAPVATPPSVVAATMAAPKAAPAPTPVAAPIAAPIAAPVAAPMAAPVTAVAPAPAPQVASPIATARPAARPSAPAPRISMGAPRVSGATAAPAPRPSGRHSKSFGLISDATPSRFTLDESQKKLAAGAAVLAVVLAALAFMQSRKPADPEARAFAALADTTGVTSRAERAKIEDITLADSSTARLGAESSLRAGTTFGDGARALRLSGPVSLSLRVDSSALAAIEVGSHRFITAGGAVAFNTDAAGLVLVQVDTGDVVLVRDSSRVRLVAGSVVRIGTGTPMPLTRAQRDAAFGWRQGRLQLAGETLTATGAAVRRWYGLDLRFPSERSGSDTLSFNAPLADRDSLAAALGEAMGARAEISGDRLTLRVAPTPRAEPRRPVPAVPNLNIVLPPA